MITLNRPVTKRLGGFGSLEGSISRPYAWESCRRLVATLTTERQEYLKLLKTGKVSQQRLSLTLRRLSTCG